MRSSTSCTGRFSNRIESFTEFQHHFSENVLGQIPKEKTEGKLSLLQPDDVRHVLAESYRNIRSSIFFMPYKGSRPKTILITSSVPNEGKSTIASNLAITMALSGARTLLIDSDLRRGALREAFGVSSRVGFAEVLREEVNWRDVVVPTSYPNLFLLPRGRPFPIRVDISWVIQPTLSSRKFITTTITSSSTAHPCSRPTIPQAGRRKMI